MLFYKLFQSKDDLAAILKRYCCHGNLTYKFILTTVRPKSKYILTLWLDSDMFLDSNRPTQLLQRIIISQKYDLNYVFFDLIKKSHLEFYVRTCACEKHESGKQHLN